MPPPRCWRAVPDSGDPDEVAWAAVLQLKLAGLRHERPRRP